MSETNGLGTADLKNFDKIRVFFRGWHQHVRAARYMILRCGGDTAVGLTQEERKYIDRLYRDMYHSLYTYAYGILGNQYLAEESVQEAFRVACDKPKELIACPKPKGWLMEALKNIIRNAQRKRAMLEKYIAMLEPADLDRLVRPDCGDDVDLMYSDLVSPAEFHLLKRVDIEGYTMLEMAEELGINVETCKKRAQRAREKMRQQLEGSGVP